MEKIHLKEITADTLIDILKLNVSEDQKHFVAPNSVSIAQAHYSDVAWFRAIYLDETPIGFVMLDDDPKEGENHHYDLWRYMIDQKYQGKGYGRKALEEVIAFIRKESNQKDMSLSVVPGKGSAEPFYQSFGFIDTGDVDEGEKIYKLIFKV